jgi:putative peptidoglycan lipid II flippase
MLYINVSTDLFFASFIEDAAASLRYANFIALTPLGIISNMILVPFMPVFSRLAIPDQWPELKVRIRQGLLLTALTMLPLTAIFVAISGPIVRVIYQRGAFNAGAAEDVAPVLVAYGLGLFFYLARDVLVRVFYALGDGTLPFKVSILNIGLNAFLDYLFYQPFGASGLVFATIGVNIVSMVIFLGVLHRRLGGLALGEWSLALLALTGITALAAGGSRWASQQWENYFGVTNFGLDLLQLAGATVIALLIFGMLAVQLKLPEVDLLVERLARKLKKS